MIESLRLRLRANRCRFLHLPCRFQKLCEQFMIRVITVRCVFHCEAR